MRMKLRWVLFLLVAVSLAAQAWADGTQTGSIGGVVKDVSGAPLPGALITAKGVESGFLRTAVSDTNGTYSIRLLPPATYRLDITLSGFQSVSSVATVFTERNTEFDATLKLSSLTEAVSVTAELPVVDKTNTTQGANISQAFTQKLAVARQYQSVMQLAPGVTGPAGNSNVRGALGSNNVFLFDGIDSTDTTTGTFGQNFNYEAMQEIAVNTGGFSAEYGRASGAIVSVVTKSGGNEFHGSAKLIATNDNWNAQNSGKNEVTGAGTQRTIFDENQYRYSFTLGGPGFKDKLWFFGAYEYAPTTTPAQQTAVGQEFQQKRKITLWQGKVTWQISPSHTFEVAGNGDPFDGILRNDYYGVSVTGDVEALTAQKQGGKTFRGTWNGIFGAALSGEATVGTSTSRIDVNQYTTNPTHPFYLFNGANVSTTQASAPHYDESTGIYYNGATFDGFVERPRTQANIALNFYKQIAGHNHNFKAGVDYQYLESQASFAYPDNAWYGDQSFDYKTRQFVPDVVDIFDPATPSTSKGHIYSFYLLDKMDLGRLFMNIRLPHRQAGRQERHRQDHVRPDDVLSAPVGQIRPHRQGGHARPGQLRAVLPIGHPEFLGRLCRRPSEVELQRVRLRSGHGPVRVRQPNRAGRQQLAHQRRPEAHLFRGHHVRPRAPARARDRRVHAGHVPEVEEHHRRRADAKRHNQDDRLREPRRGQAPLPGPRIRRRQALREQLVGLRLLHAQPHRGKPLRQLRERVG